MTTYSLYLDDVDLVLLPVQGWSNNKFLKKELFEFQLLLKEDVAEDPNTNTAHPCHICAVDAPAAFWSAHCASAKHRANVRIATAAAQRTSALITATLPPRTPPSTEQFCDSCTCIAGKDHEKTKEHKLSIIQDNMLCELAKLYIKEEELKIDDVEKEKEGTIKKKVKKQLYKEVAKDLAKGDCDAENVNAPILGNADGEIIEKVKEEELCNLAVISNINVEVHKSQTTDPTVLHIEMNNTGQQITEAYTQAQKHKTYKDTTVKITSQKAIQNPAPVINGANITAPQNVTEDAAIKNYGIKAKDITMSHNGENKQGEVKLKNNIPNSTAVIKDNILNQSTAKINISSPCVATKTLKDSVSLLDHASTEDEDEIHDRLMKDNSELHCVLCDLLIPNSDDGINGHTHDPTHISNMIKALKTISLESKDNDETVQDNAITEQAIPGDLNQSIVFEDPPFHFLDPVFYLNEKQIDYPFVEEGTVVRCVTCDCLVPKQLLNRKEHLNGQRHAAASFSNLD